MEQTPTRLIHDSEVNRTPQLLIDQIKAAGPVFEALREMEQTGDFDKNDPSLIGVAETDVYKLRRGLCLPSATGVAINHVLGERFIGDIDGVLNLGDIYRILIPHHGKYASADLHRGWLVVNPSGDMYHHAAIAIARACDLDGCSLQGFNSFDDLRELVDHGAGVTVSLNNRFVIEQSLSGSSSVHVSGNETLIRVDTESGPVWKPFQDGRHVVNILDMSNNHVMIGDSFNLPQTGKHGLTVEIPISEADRYLRYHDGATTRALVFANGDLSNTTNIKTHIPEPVVASAKNYISHKVKHS